MEGILAFDLGTSGVKCSLFGMDGTPLAAKYGQYRTYFDGKMHEQAPADWLNSIIEATKALTCEHPEIKVQAVGVSGHSLGAIPIDRSGTLLAQRVPIWSDARADAQADAFFRLIDERSWYETTGNGFPRSRYALFKIMWYREHQPALYEKAAQFIGTKDYINLFLTGQVGTDPSYASGSGAYDLKNGCYRADYAAAAGIDLEKLPQIIPSAGVVGKVTEQAAKQLGIPSGIPVACGGVDNACMTLGAGCWQNGEAYASLGSSAWITASVDRPVVDYESRIYTFAHCVPGQYLPGVGIFASGSALAWAADTFFPNLTGADRFDRLGELAAKAPAGANGVLFNPCLAGGSSFDKSPNIRGALFHLDLQNTPNDIARAAFEGIALHLRLAAQALERTGVLGEQLLVVGGGAKGSFARQVYADVFNRRIAVSRVRQDAASLGAAALAAVSCGAWRDFTPIRKAHGNPDVTCPNKDNAQCYDTILPVYKHLSDACSDLSDELNAL